MTNIIVVFHRIEDAKSIKNVLVRNGFNVTAACARGAQVLERLDNGSEGIVITGYQLGDMIYSDLKVDLPEGTEMLLLASGRYLEEIEEGVIGLPMPLKVHELIDTVSMLVQNAERRRRRRKQQPRVRSEKEASVLAEAKRLLMERNQMSEEEAHRYIQKCSMDSGTNMAETAEMVLMTMRFS